MWMNAALAILVLAQSSCAPRQAPSSPYPPPPLPPDAGAGAEQRARPTVTFEEWRPNPVGPFAISHLRMTPEGQEFIDAQGHVTRVGALTEAIRREQLKGDSPLRIVLDTRPAEGITVATLVRNIESLANAARAISRSRSRTRRPPPARPAWTSSRSMRP